MAQLDLKIFLLFPLSLTFSLTRTAIFLNHLIP